MMMGVRRRMRRGRLESAYAFMSGTRVLGCVVLTECCRFKGMSVDDFLGGGFMQGASDDEDEGVSLIYALSM